MARLIDADIFLKTTRFQEGRYPCKDIVEDIESQTTVDAVPVVHGRWIWTEKGEQDYEQFWVCSECGEHTYFVTNYCADCGAKMELERE